MIGFGNECNKKRGAGTSTVPEKSGIVREMNNLGEIVSELEKQASRLEEKLQLVCFPLPPSNPEGTATAPIEPCALTIELASVVKRLETLRVNYESTISRLDL